MKRRFSLLCILIVTLLAACAPQAVPTPTVDVIGTRSVELASMMLTQTVAAYSPTPLPSPTFTATPAFTETPTLEPTPAITAMPKVKGLAPCYTGPGPSYDLIVNITDFNDVPIVGIGSVPGWYVIINPSFNSQCWIAAENLIIDPNSNYEAMPTVMP